MTQDIRLVADFPSEAEETRKLQDQILKVLKVKNCELRILALAKLSFKNEGEVKTFPEKN